MDRKYIDDHHVVARYLADQLPDTEREAFESYYLEHPEVVQDLEAAARLKVGLAQLQTRGELDSLLTQKPRTLVAPPWLAAAAVLAAVAIGLGIFFKRGPSGPPMLARSAAALVVSGAAPLANIDRYTILRTRGTTVDAEVEIPTDPQAITLRILPEFEAQPARYRVTLDSVINDNSTKQIASVEGLVPDTNGFVSVFLNSSRIPVGTYNLAIAGDKDTTAADTPSLFTLAVKAREPSPH
jgi:hypothetical protein